MPKYLWVTALVIIFDQATKWVAETQLAFHKLTPVLPYFDWYLAHNKGAAFSFLADQSGWQRWFLAALTVGVSTFIFLWLKSLKPNQKYTMIALSLILGGAIGNLIDRVLLGYVIDFIQVWLGTYPWPSFNIADSAICVGAVLLIYADLFLSEKDLNDKSTTDKELSNGK